MTKKDRSAINICIIWFIITTMWSASIGKIGPLGLLFLLPVSCYWGYRFTKNDISFIKSKDERESEKKKSSIKSIPDALAKWNDLLAKGAITQEEYDKAKRDLLG